MFLSHFTSQRYKSLFLRSTLLAAQVLLSASAFSSCNGPEGSTRINKEAPERSTELPNQDRSKFDHMAGSYGYEYKYNPANPQPLPAYPDLNRKRDPALKDMADSLTENDKKELDSILTLAKKPRVQTEQTIMAKKIISCVSEKSDFRERMQRELRDIVQNHEEQSILDHFMKAIFAEKRLDWKKMLKCLDKSGITIKDLCNLGLSPNIPDIYGGTVLACIMPNDRSKEANNCIDFLLEKGAIVSPPNPVEYPTLYPSALKSAFSREDRRLMVVKLLMHNASMQKSLYGGDRCLLVEAIKDQYNKETIEFLILQGSDVNQGMKAGSHPPLHAAIDRGDESGYDIVQLLIDYKVELNAKGSEKIWEKTSRFSPLDHAKLRSYNCPRIIDLLERHGAKSASDAYYHAQSSWDAWFDNLWKERFENCERPVVLHTDSISNSTNSSPEELTKACATLTAHFGKTITEKTDAAELKNLSRKCALKYHPDKNTDAPASEQKEKAENFTEMMNALDILAKYRS